MELIRWLLLPCFPGLTSLSEEYILSIIRAIRIFAIISSSRNYLKESVLGCGTGIRPSHTPKTGLLSAFVKY